LQRFGTGVDGLHAAILFSDILIVPYAMGQKLWFEAGEGPRLAPTLLESDIDAMTPDYGRYDAIYETVGLVKAELAPETTFLGFAGSPWTIATYMVAGQGSKDQAAARKMAYAHPERFGVIIDAIVEATVPYLIGQIDAGVDAIQLFDSWAGSLSPQQFRRWVIAPTGRLWKSCVWRVRVCRSLVFPRGREPSWSIMRVKREWMRLGWMKRWTRSGPTLRCPRDCRFKVISIHWC
jgi:uroporphyrinogen decarboxylase